MKLTERLSEIKRNFKLYLPFIIAGLMTLASMILVWTKPEFTDKNGEVLHYIVSAPVKYFAYGLLLNLILIILHKDIWKYTFTLQLLVATWGLISVISTTYKVGIGAIELEVISGLLLFCHLFVNRETIKTLINKKDVDPEREKLIRQKEKEAAVGFFFEKFNDKSQSELEDIMNSGDYSLDAKEAAKRLLAKK